jgi:hypothetical protein
MPPSASKYLLKKIPTLFGGSNKNKYYKNKYLKYKNKYIKLKNELN